jgi:hypothetical protein
VSRALFHLPGLAAADRHDVAPVPVQPADLRAGGPAGSGHPAQPEPGHTCEFCERIEAQLAAGAPAAREAPALAAGGPSPPAAPTPPPPPAGDPGDALPGEPRPRSRRRLLIVVAAVVGLALVAVILVVTLNNGSHHGAAIKPQTRPSAASVAPTTAASAGASDELVAAATWAAQQLPHSAALLADTGAGPVLTGDGFVAVAVAGGATPVPFEYVVSTPQLRATAATNSGVASALSSSTPVAVFGSAADQVAIRQASADPGAVVAARRAADQQTRLGAENELLKNPAVQVSDAARLALQAGELDLRAATVIAYLANSSHLEVVAVNLDPPEQAAGLPVRSVDIRIDTTSATQTVLAALPVSYQPMSVTPLSNGASRFVWPLEAEPMPVLN